jgi:Ca2+-binding RTX toxin-like protein
VAWNIGSSWQIGTDQKVKLEGLTNSEAVIIGGEGVDQIILGDTDDALFLHDSFSRFNAGISLEVDSLGQSGTARVSGVEAIYGGGGNDIIDLTSPDYSQAGQRIAIFGGDGNDVIWGADGDDSIEGGLGDDVIFSGAGTDYVTGGSGCDTFEFTKTSTDVTLLDFDPSEGDRLMFFNSVGVEFDISSLQVTGGGIRIGYLDSQISGYSYLDIHVLDAALLSSLDLAALSAATEIL